MTPKPDSATLTQLADLLNGDSFDLVFGAMQDIRNEHPRPRSADGQPLDIDSGDLLNALIARLRMTAAGLATPATP